ncbi:hypothetical protein WJX84_006155 [Apatococcus fuscideae]|uniref:PsbP C-terminal domain-containing protein n=1 Tax=Apatococcus fuscideae TaxID=2026836 RepID=A0AAW1T750_9CHLO
METAACSCQPRQTSVCGQQQRHTRPRLTVQAGVHLANQAKCTPVERRNLLKTGLLVAGAVLVQPSPVIAAEPVAQELPRSTEEFGLFELIGNVFSTLEFSMTLPDGFQYVQPGAFAGNAPAPSSANAKQPPPNPLKAKFVNGRQVITIIVRGASDIRPTFFQVTDVSQFGDVDSAKSLFVPRGAYVSSKSVERAEVGSRDTGTIAGVVPLPPQTFYRYIFEAGQTKFAISVGAIKGRLYVAGASAPKSDWDNVQQQLQDAVNSFRLATPNTPS